MTFQTYTATQHAAFHTTHAGTPRETTYCSGVWATQEEAAAALARVLGALGENESAEEREAA